MTAIATRAAPGRVPRFDRTERIVHWCNATLFLILLGTGFTLYAGPLSELVGRREMVKTIHVYSGLLLPIPVITGILLRSGRGLRADLRRLNRWDPRDRGWWFPRTRPRVKLGKFNPGQKLNAAFIGSAIVVMLMTGSIMRWPDSFSNAWRTGATFVHDWFAIFVLFSTVAHITLALGDRDALRAMVRGWIPASWALSKRPRWYAEVAQLGDEDDDDAEDEEDALAPGSAPRDPLRDL